jgi:Ca2+ transporting ATPase
MRTIYIAYKDITEKEFENCENDNKNGQYIEENNLIFLAIIAIKDPIEKEVKESIQKCKDSFINVIMVTGENIMTASSIAKDCGILNENFDINNLLPNDMEYNPELIHENFKKDEYIDKILIDQPKILTGNTFYKIIGGIFCKECDKDINLCECPKTDEEARQMAENQLENDSVDKICDIRNEQIRNIKNFQMLLRNLKVIARAEPIHKYALVLGLKALNNIVAVTGKSTNDAPTLQISDIGISMLSGTDVAKKASDIILTDNNFISS